MKTVAMYVLPGVTDTLENTDKVAVKSSVPWDYNERIE